MLEAIGAGLTSLQAALDITKGLSAIRDEVKANDVKLELQRALGDVMGALINAQREQLAQQQEVAELRTEIKRLLDWEAERKEYELADAGRGSLAYRLKNPGDAIPVWLCPTCFARGEKSILQPETRMPGRIKIVKCHSCKTELVLEGSPTASFGSARLTR
jgi:hypothetical protein